jgi:hypothetical protein
MRKRTIFSYANFQIDDKIKKLQSDVIGKFNQSLGAKYEYLEYQGADGEIIPHQVINYALKELFFHRYYQTVLILDIDCIPLSTHALQYTFEQAEKGILIGNAQRSNHLDNDEHVYVAPSAMCLTKEMFIDLDFPDFYPDHIKCDVGERLTYIAEEKGIPVEIYGPDNYECSPTGAEYWPLNSNYKNYGIGTTFVNYKNEEMFYHLFEARTNNFNKNFYDKCQGILKNDV